MSVLDPEITIEHRVFVPPVGGVRRGHEGELSDPIERKVYSIAPLQYWRSNKSDPVTLEDVNRVINDILIDVPDPSVYGMQDTVLIDGVSYEIQGQPDQEDWGSNMPFPDYNDMFGAEIHARRVT